MKIAGIYKILHKPSGRYYVGSSNSVIRRMVYEHRKMLVLGVHFNARLQNAWNKYGEVQFEFVIVETFPETVTNKELLAAEQKHLDVLKDNPRKGYNTTFTAGKVEFTKQVREKMRVATKRYLKLHGHPFEGKHHTELTKKHLSSINTGKILSSSTKKKISGKKSVAHRLDVKAKKRQWWDNLKQDSAAYAEFCKNRAIKLAEKRYGNYAYAKNYEVVHN